MRSTYYPGLVFTVGSAYATLISNNYWSHRILHGLLQYIHFGILTMQSAICYIWT